MFPSIVGFCRFLLLFVILPSAAAYAAEYSFERDPGSHSLWIQDLDQIEITGEWLSDGTLIGMSGPFNPFRYHSSKVETAEIGTQIIPYKEGLGIAADNRAVYVRDEQGRFSTELLFKEDGNFGCHEGPGTAYCRLVYAQVDSRGLGRISVVNERGEFKSFYWTGDQYREAKGLETVIDSDPGANAQWSPDGKEFLRFLSLATGLSYEVYSEDGRKTHELKIDENASYPEDILKNEDGFFVYASVPGINLKFQLMIFRLQDPFGKSPRLVRIGATSLFNDSDLVFLGIDATHLYYSIESQIESFQLSNGLVKPLQKCPGTLVALDREASAGTGSQVVACGDSLIRLQAGLITQEWETSSPIKGGTVFEDQEGVYDIAIVHEDDGIERLRNGDPIRKVRILPLQGPPNDLYPLWEEGQDICGYVKSGRTTACRNQGVWQKRDLGLGSIGDVRFINGSWWALSQSAGKRSIFRRNDRWEKQQEWAGDGPLFFVRNGPDGLAVGLGGGHFSVFDGQGFSEAYSHKSSEMLARPAIGSDGFLYDICPGSQNASEARPCLVNRDGSMEFLNLDPANQPPVFVPLKRGVLYWTSDSEIYILRGHRVIEAEHLYGELMATQDTFFELADLGNGSVLIKKTISTDTGDRTEYFVYDGESLQSTPPSPSRNALPFRFNGTPDIEPIDLQQLWQSQDGLWRTFNGGSTDPIRYGKTAVDAFANRQRVAPDFAHDAARWGDQTVLATDDGIWSCPTTKGTRVEERVHAIPQSAGCRRARDWPFVERILPLSDDSLLVGQAGRILHLTSLEGAPVTPLSAADGRLLGSAGNEAVWVVGKKIQRYSSETRKVESIDIPSGITKINAVAAQWICGQNALYHRSAAGVWEKASLPAQCLGLAARGDTAWFADNNRLMRCQANACEVLGALPRSFYPGGAIGLWPSENESLVPLLALGDQLYQWVEESKTFVDRTPRYSFGSALIAPVTRINESGVLSLDGGGALTYGKEAEQDVFYHTHIE